METLTPSKRFLLQENINSFILTKDSPYTKVTYHRILHQWQNSTVFPEDIESWKYLLIKKGLKPTTISTYLTCIREFFTFLENKGKIKYNPSKNVKGPKKPQGHLKDELSADEAKKLLNQIDKTTLLGKRNYAMVSLMIITGLRGIEVIRANIEDLREKEGRKVLWIQGKGRSDKDDFVVIDDALFEILWQYLEERGEFQPSWPLFASVRIKNKRLSTAALRKQIDTYLKPYKRTKRISVHSLRHTSITIALSNGAPLLKVQQMARHSNVNTTLGYFHENNRLRSCAEDYVSKAILPKKEKNYGE